MQHLRLTLKQRFRRWSRKDCYEKDQEKPKTRKRIFEFEWKRNGVTQSLREDDFFDRKSFMNI